MVKDRIMNSITKNTAIAVLGFLPKISHLFPFLPRHILK
jgi:hypothetical protein